MANLRFPSINLVVISGRLVDDSNVKELPSGSKILEFRIALTRRYMYNEEMREEPLFINCVYTGKAVEDYSQLLKKGFPIIIEGRLRYREWKDQNDNKKYTYEIFANRIHLLQRSENEQTVNLVSNDDNEDEEVNKKFNFDEEEVGPNDLPF
jgi:single-strand DNA-binding protein